MKRAQLTAIALWCWAWLAAACGSPLVGLECKKGYTRCGDECFDLKAEALHCGACGVACEDNEMCIDSECRVEVDLDATAPDGSADSGVDGGVDLDAMLDGGRDGGNDGSPNEDAVTPGDADSDGGAQGDADAASDADAGSAVDAGDAEITVPDAAVPPPLCSGPGSPADCVCGIGELKCGLVCVDANTDLNNCGGCDNVCPTPQVGQEFCIDGECTLNCALPRTACFNSICVDLSRDPDNCGTCGFRCASGLCRNSACLDRAAGHVIVIGHDMRDSVAAMQRLAGNAMFLPARQVVRGMIYRQYSPPEITDGLAAAINKFSDDTGRTFQIVGSLNPSVAQVLLTLDRVDVFVIAAQNNATLANLTSDVAIWSQALVDFVRRGGVIVLFDSGGANGGTHQLLRDSGLFTAAGITSLPNQTVEIFTQSDAVALEVPAEYQSRAGSVTFTGASGVVVVRDSDTERPVVLHVTR